MTKEAKILIGIGGVVIIGGLLLAVFANPQPIEPGKVVDNQALIRENSYMTKASTAKVNIVEFGDYQCPACGAAHPNLKKIIEDYKDNPDVNFVFRNFPLDTIHPNAHISSEAAEAAGAQGKYWEMHDLLYQRQSEWEASPSPVDIFARYAAEIGLDVEKFKSEVSSRKYAEVIRADQSDGEAAGVNSTPTIFINGEKSDSYQYDALKAKIEEMLKQ